MPAFDSVPFREQIVAIGWLIMVRDTNSTLCSRNSPTEVYIFRLKGLIILEITYNRRSADEAKAVIEKKLPVVDDDELGSVVGARVGPPRRSRETAMVGLTTVLYVLMFNPSSLSLILHVTDWYDFLLT